MAAIRALMLKQKRQFLNMGRIIREQSRFKRTFVICFAICCEMGLWVLFLRGFMFLDALGGIGIMIVGRMFSLFFLGMGMMLIMSGIVTSYSTIYRTPEIPFLLVRPFSMSQIVLTRFVDSTALSSWAFFFVVVPFIGAYALHQRMSPLFSLWTFVFSVPFLVLCSGAGALIAMLFVRWFPRKRSWLAGMWLAIATVGLLGYVYIRRTYIGVADDQFNLVRLIPGLNLAARPMLPSWWISEGIMALGRGEWWRGAKLLAVITASALFITMCVEWLGSATFYESWQRVNTGLDRRDRAPVMLAGLRRAVRFLPEDVGAMVLKDLRTFFRDPMQWSQALVFFGLLGFYFANIRSFNYDTLGPQWRHWVGFLNVFSISAVVCSLGSRFVYPQLSLEGQGFWLLGLSPASMKRIVLTKFFTSLLGMLTVSVLLVCLSASRMQVGTTSAKVGAGLAAAISCAVCGLSTGLGAVFLDLSRRNPAAIVSGFGGTLNLVCSLGFMLAAIIPFGMLFHLLSLEHIRADQFHYGLAWASLWLVLLTTAATLVPLRLGIRSLEGRDF